MTDTEVEFTFKIYREIKEAFGCDISSIPVDNADNYVAVRAVEKLGTEGEPKDHNQVVVCLDCAHCLDLMPENLIETSKTKDIMGEVKEVYHFISTHCINIIQIVR